jgi:hypothetical protein
MVLEPVVAGVEVVDQFAGIGTGVRPRDLEGVGATNQRLTRVNRQQRPRR